MKGKESTNQLQTNYFRTVVFLLIIGIALFAFRDQIFDATNEEESENTTVEEGNQDETNEEESENATGEPQQTIGDLEFSAHNFYADYTGYNSREITLSESFDEFKLELPDSFHLKDSVGNIDSEIVFRDEEGEIIRTRQLDPNKDNQVFSYDSEAVGHISIRVMVGFAWDDFPSGGNFTDYLNENSAIQLGFNAGD